MTDTSHPTVEQWLASLGLTDEAWLALWPDFCGGASRSSGKITLVLANNRTQAVVQARALSILPST